jgi:hypothetical protein
MSSRDSFWFLAGALMPHSGDLVGTVTSVNPRGGHIVNISIDRHIG